MSKYESQVLPPLLMLVLLIATAPSISRWKKIGRESSGGDLVVTEDTTEIGTRCAGNATVAVGRANAMGEENKIRTSPLGSRIITTSRSDAIVRFVDGSRMNVMNGYGDDEIPQCGISGYGSHWSVAIDGRHFLPRGPPPTTPPSRPV